MRVEQINMARNLGYISQALLLHEPNI